MVKVSILLTSYNHGRYLKKSIDSILNQTYKDFELIIVDDCSTDDSYSIIEGYNDKRIKKIRHEVNIGYCMTKELVKSFKGKYFAIAHSDDIWEKEKLEKQVKYLDENSNVAACFTWVKLINEQDEEIKSNNGAVYTDFNVENRTRYEWLNHFFYKGNCLCHPSVLLRKDAQLDENLFVRGLGSFPDLYRWVKLCLHHDIYVYPEKLSCFRVRENGKNTSGVNKANLIRNYFDFLPLLNLYKDLTEEEFLKVFKETSKYLVNGKINKNYALARMCIDDITMPPHILFGLMLIFETLQDDKQMKELEDLYNYKPKDLKKETANNDVFKRLQDFKFMTSTLYFSNATPFNDNNKFTLETFVKTNKSFKISYTDINKKVTSIRFDPDEGEFRKFDNIEIYINGEKVQYKLINGEYKDNTIYFFTTDPMILIDYNGIVDNVLITGNTELISKDEFNNIIRTLKNELNEINSKKISIFKRRRKDDEKSINARW